MSICARNGCRAIPMRGARFCYFHNDDPEVIERVKAARSRGGARSHNRAKITPPKNASEVQKVLADVISAVSVNKVSAEQAAALARLCELYLKAVELSDLDTRLRRVEAERLR